MMAYYYKKQEDMKVGLVLCLIKKNVVEFELKFNFCISYSEIGRE